MLFPLALHQSLMSILSVYVPLCIHKNTLFFSFFVPFISLWSPGWPDSDRQQRVLHRAPGEGAAGDGGARQGARGVPPVSHPAGRHRAPPGPPP